MANNKSFYLRIAQTNAMPDGMLKKVNYEDFALVAVAKDRPVEPIYINDNEKTNTFR